jgi:ABC-type branched-subunit amino acid transport system ATPase component
MPPHQRVQRHIALVPEGRHLWPGMSVEDNLKMGAMFSGTKLSSSQSKSRKEK